MFGVEDVYPSQNTISSSLAAEIISKAILLYIEEEDSGVFEGVEFGCMNSTLGQNLPFFAFTHSIIRFGCLGGLPK